MPRPPDLTEEDDGIINSLVVGFTARQLAEELVRRCGCAFDHRLPDNAPPHHECDYHRELREGRLTADDLENLIDLLERLVDGDIPRYPDMRPWIPVLLKLRTMAAGLK